MRCKTADKKLKEKPNNGQKSNSASGNENRRKKITGVADEVGIIATVGAPDNADL